MFDLSMVDSIKLQNGNEYFVFKNKNGEEVFLENLNKSQPLEQQFYKLVQRFNINLSSNPVENTKVVLEFMSKNINKSLKMIPIDKISMDDPLIQYLPAEKRNEIIFLLLNNSKYNLNIQYINLDECVGIDKNGKIYDAETIDGVVQLVGVENLNKNIKYKSQDSNNEEYEDKEILYKEAASKLAGGVDGIIIDGVLVQREILGNCLTNLELVSNLAINEQPVYKQLLFVTDELIREGNIEWKESVVKEETNNKVKQLVINRNDQAAFINKAFLVSIFSFLVGFLLSAIIMFVSFQ